MPVSNKPPHAWHHLGWGPVNQQRIPPPSPLGEGSGVRLSPFGEGLGGRPCQPTTHITPLSPWRGAGGEAFIFWRGVGGEPLSTNNAHHSPLPLERGRGWGFSLSERGWGWGFCQFISKTFNIMSAIFVTNRQPHRKKSILARVYLGAKTS